MRRHSQSWSLPIGKPYAEALGEVREIIDTCDFFLGEGRRLYGQTVPSEMPDKQLFTFRRPVGTVAVITAGNFPVAVPAWCIVPALLAGNTVVWKPAEYSAVSSAAFHELFVRGGGLPDGVFNVRRPGQRRGSGVDSCHARLLGPRKRHDLCLPALVARARALSCPWNTTRPRCFPTARTSCALTVTRPGGQHR